MLKLMTFALAAVVGAMTFSVGEAAANDYWRGHWNWYDNHYRPYYHRHHSYRPHYHGYGYQNYPYYGSHGHWGGHRDWSGGSVQIGPLRFGWR